MTRVRKWPHSRSFVPPKSINKLRKIETFHSRCQSTKWIVTTTIFPASYPVEQFDELQDWCTVVVGDRKGKNTEDYYASPASDRKLRRVIYLDVDAQERLKFESLKHTPWNHFARKNIGFLFAILQGATVVYDTDDDNVLLNPEEFGFVSGETPTRVFKPRSTTRKRSNNSMNIYKAFGSRHIWPRGLPLDTVSQSIQYNPNNIVAEKDLIEFSGVMDVQQALVEEDPDVDAIYRLTLQLPYNFDTEFSQGPQFRHVLIPHHVFVPCNAQTTFFLERALWALYLPMTVHGRVSDIWRCYFFQTLFPALGLNIAFTSPIVKQIRNPHDYLADFQSEIPLYTQSGALIAHLKKLSLGKKLHSSKSESRLIALADMFHKLFVEMYEYGIIDTSDVLGVDAWFVDLIRMDYKFAES